MQVSMISNVGRFPLSPSFSATLDVGNNLMTGQIPSNIGNLVNVGKDFVLRVRRVVCG